MSADDPHCGMDTHQRVLPAGTPRGEAHFRSKRRMKPKLIVDEDFELLPLEHGATVTFDRSSFEEGAVWVATKVQQDFTAYHAVSADEAISNVRLLLRLAADDGRHTQLDDGSHRFSWQGFSAFVTPDLGTVVRYRTNHYERTPQMVADGVRSRLGKRARAGARRRKRLVPDGLHEGAIRDGQVASIVSFGAFIEIGSFEGLLHVSEMGEQVDDTHTLLAVGETVRVEIISIDLDRNQVSLRRIST